MLVCHNVFHCTSYLVWPFRESHPLLLAGKRSPSRSVLSRRRGFRANCLGSAASRLKDFGRVTSNDELSIGERWYVARTLPNREVGAAMQLGAQGFRVFLPKIARTVRHARKMRLVRAPAFPAYLFVALDLNRDRWRSVNGTFGVARLVGADERPLPVPRGVVEAMLDTLDETGVCRFDQGLLTGQRVRVIRGPFAEQLGELVRLDGAGRVRVLLEIMGGKIPAIVRSSDLVAAC